MSAQAQVATDNPAGQLPAVETVSADMSGFQLSGPQKAAIVIALLGREFAGPVVEKIGDRHLKVFLSAYENMKLVPRQILLHAVEDFIANLEIVSAGLKCGQKEARGLAEEILDEKRMEKLFGNAQIIEEADENETTVWHTLAQRKSAEIAGYLEKQRPQVAAIVLSKVPSGKAGEILGEIDDEVSTKIVSYLTRPGKIDPITLSTIGKVIDTEFLSVEGGGEKNDNPLKSVGEIFSVLPTAKREALIEFLTEKDEAIAEQVKKGIITFEDLPDRLPRNAVPIIFREADTVDLLKALKMGQGNAPESLEFLFSNISQRMADQFKEQLEDIADISQKEGEAAQSVFMATVSRLEKEGRLSLIPPPDPAGE
ncbi:FliG C-terminal domain-containing protein [Parvularcula sp. IMCC14364]|uniref:FliG C-terminal domain-containing protein n=1 Tax=Parvularcula sp. IMCC14364 TaxID=3067902 RepID=UPI0027428885|nr:FliG C-terminal domain-containing protein [Parvularcula sp. IMCC14364]